MSETSTAATWLADRSYSSALTELSDLTGPDGEAFSMHSLATTYEDKPDTQLRLAGVIGQAIARRDIVVQGDNAELFFTSQGAARVMSRIDLIHS